MNPFFNPNDPNRNSIIELCHELLEELRYQDKEFPTDQFQDARNDTPQPVGKKTRRSPTRNTYFIINMFPR